jgi:hypothetical protein
MQNSDWKGMLEGWGFCGDQCISASRNSGLVKVVQTALFRAKEIHQKSLSNWCISLALKKGC